MLRIKDVMTPQAEVISPDATTEDAAALMKTLDIGVLPVCDEEGLVAARWAHHDPRPCLLPPDWSGGYTSIFAVQQEEDWQRERPKVAAGGMM